MEERLTIRNFGPIREADIAVRDLTIFVGPQATGKSLAAQILYFLRGIEDLILPDPDKPSDKLAAILFTMEDWFGNAPSVYAGPGTSLCWHPMKTGVEATHEIRWDREGIHLSQVLEGQVSEKRVWGRKRNGVPEEVYIPAGRSLYSLIPPHLFPLIFSRRTRLSWPSYIFIFYDTLGAIVNQLWQIQEAEPQQPLSSVDSSAAFLRRRAESIVKGRIRYGPDTILLETDGKLLRPATIAAGQMELWPFWAIVEASLQLGLYSPTQIYFEEPEAHLHPGAQRSVMEIIAFLVRKGVRFVITTHSPYILYAVNNFLTAQEVLDAGRTLPDDVPPETALRSDQVAAYRFAPDGTVHDIMDTEIGLIDGDELDQVADDLGATFTDLLERLESAE